MGYKSPQNTIQWYLPFVTSTHGIWVFRVSHRFVKGPYLTQSPIEATRAFGTEIEDTKSNPRSCVAKGKTPKGVEKNRTADGFVGERERSGSRAE